MAVKVIGPVTGQPVTLTRVGRTPVTTNAGGWAVPDAGSAGTITIVRHGLDSANLFAPATTMFDVDLSSATFDSSGPVAATAAYDESYHEIDYYWNFDDAGSVPLTGLNILAEHENTNIAYGPTVAHTFINPGTYTVTVWAVEKSSGKYASGTLQVVIKDPDVDWPAADTWMVDPAGTYAGADTYLDASNNGGVIPVANRVTSFDTVTNSGHANPQRFIVKGVTHTISTCKQLNNTYNGWHVQRDKNDVSDATFSVTATAADIALISGLVGVWDDNTRNGRLNDTTQIAFTFQNITFTTGYDPATQEPDESAVPLFWGRGNPAYYVCLSECTTIGGNTMFGSDIGQANHDNQLNVYSHMHNVLFSDWQDFGLYHAWFGRLSVVGCSARQKQTAIAGSNKWVEDTGGTVQKPERGNLHGPFRVQSGKNLIFDACDIASNTGWFENLCGHHTCQPCIRTGHTTQSELLRINITRCNLEGGLDCLNFSRIGAEQDAKAFNGIVDMCRLTYGYRGQSAITSNNSGLTVRNSLFHAGARVKDNPYAAQAISTFVQLVNNNLTVASTAENLAAPIKIYNNTFTSKNTTATPPVYLNTGADTFNDAYTAVTEINNVTYFPSHTTPSTPDISTTAVFTPHYDAYRDFSHPVQVTLASDVADGSTFTVPYGSFGGGVTGSADFDLASSELRKVNNFFVPPSVLSYSPFRLDASGHYRIRTEYFSFTADGTGIVVTNNSGVTWPSGTAVVVAPTRNVVYVRTEYATPADTIMDCRFNTAPASATGDIAYRDFKGNISGGMPLYGGGTEPGSRYIGAYDELSA